MQRARSTVDEAVELVLASRGEDVHAISEPRGFLVTPQFLDLLSTNVLMGLYNQERSGGLKLPAEFRKAATGESRGPHPPMPAGQRQNSRPLIP